MAKLIYDENVLVDQQMYKYDKFLHSRINKYTGNSRTLVTYFNINDKETSLSFGMETHYAVLGKDSPLRFDKIENMALLGFTQLTPEESNASSTNVRNYSLSGDAFVIPGTILPKENDFFIVNHLNMNHLFRVTHVTQDGLNTDGSYKIDYVLYSSDMKEIQYLYDQVVGTYIMDLQTIGGEDLTPVIGKEDYELRSRLIEMVEDMTENYISRFYNQTHNCFILNLNGQSLFDLCGNMFMAKHGVMINDNSSGNIVLNPNKVRTPLIDSMYQRSPYKWIERDAPLRYLESFKYYLMKGSHYKDSTFAMYGHDVDVIIPGYAQCNSPDCEKFFPDEVVFMFEKECDSRSCKADDCNCCDKIDTCCRHLKCQRFDYVSIIHDFIHGKLTNMHRLSLYTGDQLFDNSDSKEVYLWTPIIIYIIIF